MMAAACALIVGLQWEDEMCVVLVYDQSSLLTLVLLFPLLETEYLVSCLNL